MNNPGELRAFAAREAEAGAEALEDLAVSAEHADAWRELMEIGPDQALSSNPQIGQWVALGFSPEAAAPWMELEHPPSPGTAYEMAFAGASPGEYAALHTALWQWDGPGGLDIDISQYRAARWVAIDAGAALGRQVSVSEVASLCNADVGWGLPQAVMLLDAGIDADEAARARHAGLVGVREIIAAHAGGVPYSWAAAGR